MYIAGYVTLGIVGFFGTCPDFFNRRNRAGLFLKRRFTCVAECFVLYDVLEVEFIVEMMGRVLFEVRATAGEAAVLYSVKRGRRRDISDIKQIDLLLIAAKLLI